MLHGARKQPSTALAYIHARARTSANARVEPHRQLTFPLTQLIGSVPFSSACFVQPVLDYTATRRLYSLIVETIRGVQPRWFASLLHTHTIERSFHACQVLSLHSKHDCGVWWRLGLERMLQQFRDRTSPSSKIGSLCKQPQLFASPILGLGD